MRLRRLPLLTFSLLLGAGCVSPPPYEDGTVRDDLNTAVDAVIKNGGLDGAALIILDETGETYRREVGNLDPNTPIRIASASKWISAAVIMSVVESGRLDLGTKVGSVLPDYPPAVAEITLRQLMSHTSGIQPDLVLKQPRVASLDASARLIASAPLEGPPGSRFHYGGSSMQIAARMAEVATGRTWQEIYSNALAEPLAVGGEWGHPLREGDAVPYVAGGLRISMNDYLRFMAMFLGEGSLGGKRVLKPGTVRQIETDQLDGVTAIDRPSVVPGAWRYGMGVWCEAVRPDRSCSIVSSAGAFGVFPWIERDAQRAGLFFSQAPLPQVLPAALRLRDLAKALPPARSAR